MNPYEKLIARLIKQHNARKPGDYTSTEPNSLYELEKK